MTERFEREKFITLAEAKLLSGYTPDHLAYLCRRGYMTAERQGRIWLTTASAIQDYQKTLATTGQPILAVAQKEILLPRTSNYWKLGERVGEYLEQSIAQFIIVFRHAFLPQAPAYALTPNVPALSGFAVGLPPKHLPIGSLPAYLERTPWYQNQVVLLGIFVVLAFAGGLINPEKANQISQNTAAFVSVQFAAVFEPDEHLNRLTQAISTNTPQVAGASIKAGESNFNQDRFADLLEELEYIKSNFQYELNTIKVQSKSIIFEILNQTKLYLFQVLKEDIIQSRFYFFIRDTRYFLLNTRLALDRGHFF